jgi:hypothetical protein
VGSDQNALSDQVCLCKRLPDRTLINVWRVLIVHKNAKGHYLDQCKCVFSDHLSVSGRHFSGAFCISGGCISAPGRNRIQAAGISGKASGKDLSKSKW